MTNFYIFSFEKETLVAELKNIMLELYYGIGTLELTHIILKQLTHFEMH